MGVTVRNSSKRPTNQGNKKPKLSTGYFIFFTEVDLSKETLTNSTKSYSIFYDKIALRPISDVAKTIAAKMLTEKMPASDADVEVHARPVVSWSGSGGSQGPRAAQSRIQAFPWRWISAEDKLQPLTQPPKLLKNDPMQEKVLSHFNINYLRMSNK